MQVTVCERRNLSWQKCWQTLRDGPECHKEGIISNYQARPRMTYGAYKDC